MWHGAILRCTSSPGSGVIQYRWIDQNEPWSHSSLPESADRFSQTSSPKIPSFKQSSHPYGAPTPSIALLSGRSIALSKRSICGRRLPRRFSITSHFGLLGKADIAFGDRSHRVLCDAVRTRYSLSGLAQNTRATKSLPAVRPFRNVPVVLLVTKKSKVSIVRVPMSGNDHGPSPRRVAIDWIAATAINSHCLF